MSSVAFQRPFRYKDIAWFVSSFSMQVNSQIDGQGYCLLRPL